MTKIAKCYAKILRKLEFFEVSTFSTKLDTYICAESQWFWRKNKAYPFRIRLLTFVCWL